MSKINDNTYVNKIKKEILDGRFKTKDDLIKFITQSKFIILNDSFFRQELQDSFIKLNDDTLNDMNKSLLEYYDNRMNLNVSNLNLDNVSSFRIDDKDYIKIENDGDIMVLDDSLNNDNFVKQFQERQNNLTSAKGLNADENKQNIIKDMEQDKMNAKLESSMDVNQRNLTPEEKRQFAAVMDMPISDNINFVVDTARNIYINKDNGDVYFVNKNSYGQLEVRKADEVTSEVKREDVQVIDDMEMDATITAESAIEPNFDSMGDSDLEYIYANKLDTLTDEQKARLKIIIEQRRQLQQQSVNKDKEKTSQKQFVKKLNTVMTTQYNGFVSVLFLCSVVAFFGLTFLTIIFSNI